jgi:hypothetical protein
VADRVGALKSNSGPSAFHAGVSTLIAAPITATATAITETVVIPLSQMMGWVTARAASSRARTCARHQTTLADGIGA